jgi:predicted phosphoadenosine phosphosulfate sulfurtransferase
MFKKENFSFSGGKDSEILPDMNNQLDFVKKFITKQVNKMFLKPGKFKKGKLYHCKINPQKMIQVLV